MCVYTLIDNDCAKSHVLYTSNIVHLMYIQRVVKACINLSKKTGKQRQAERDFIVLAGKKQCTKAIIRREKNYKRA